MAVRTIYTVQTNAAPPLELTARRDGVAIDLTGCTVDLIIARGTTITNTGHQACTVTDATAGVVSYDVEAGDFPDPGTYKADLKVTYGNGKSEILYDQLKIKARKKLQ